MDAGRVATRGHVQSDLEGRWLTQVVRKQERGRESNKAHERCGEQREVMTLMVPGIQRNRELLEELGASSHWWLSHVCG